MTAPRAPSSASASAAQPSGDDIKRAQRYQRSLAVLIACVALGARLWVSWRTHSLGEDALITLRYAENIAAGRGYVYNPGEHVLGTTSPLYTLLLALAAWMHLPAMRCGILLNILADSVTCYLLARLLARPEIRQPVAGLFASLLYALSSTPISISISGMETGLVACVGLAAVLAYVAGKSRPLYLLGAALFLLRIDGLLLFLLLAVGLAVRQKRIPWPDVGLFLVLLLPWLLFAALYFGSPIPASVTAKLTVYSHTASISGGFRAAPVNLEAFENQFTKAAGQRIVTLFFFLGLASILVRLARKNTPDEDTDTGRRNMKSDWRLLLVPIAWLLVYYGTMLTSRVPAFAWYFLPPWALFLAVAALGGAAAWEVARRVSFIRTLSRPVLWQAALAVVGLAGVVHLRSIAQEVAMAQALEDRVRLPLGLWLRGHVGENERVLMEPIGYLGYYSRRRVLDMVGLVSPEVLPFYHTPKALAGIVANIRPEWLCLRPSERDLLNAQDSTLFRSRYVFAQAFPSAIDPAFLLYHRRRNTIALVAACWESRRSE